MQNSKFRVLSKNVSRYVCRNDLTMIDIATLDWKSCHAEMQARGFVHVSNVLSQMECNELRGLYDSSGLYRSTINMERYRFGKGEYKYFAYPLPPMIQTLRETFYQHLAPLANDWMRQLSIDIEYPPVHKELIEICGSKNQLRPTPLILKYTAGGYNTLHQDLYGDVYFPFQIVFVLTQPQRDHTGGEFVMIEQIPRAQSRAEVIAPQQGDAVIFTTNFRPVKGLRGYYRATMKHGVSEVRSGERFSMGIIFHDAL